jgi:PAS domain S-box-containing protein
MNKVDPGKYLNKSESSVFRTVFDNNMTIMLMVDPNNNQKIIDVNQAAQEFYGYDHKQFLQLYMGDINTKSHTERKVLMKGTINRARSNYSFIHITKNGVLKDVDVNASPLYYNDKEIMFIIVNDLTIQKKVELKLRESEERLELALDGSGLGLWDWHITNGESYYDERWANIIGYTLEEISPVAINTWIDNVHPEDLKKYNIEIEKCFNREIENHQCEVRMKHKDGYWVWVLSRGKVVEWSDDGKPVRSVGTHLDITVKKESELRFIKSEIKYKSYFESSPLSLWEQDYSDIITFLNNLPLSEEGGIRMYLDAHPEQVERCSKLLKNIHVNPATLKLYEAETSEELFSNLDKIFTSNSEKHFKNKLISQFRNEEIYSSEVMHMTLSGKELYLKSVSTLLPDSRALMTITNITEERKKESELKALLSQTISDSETNQILLREINHRVKNNLSSFIGMLYAEKKHTGHELSGAQIGHVDSLINRVKGLSIAHELLSRSNWTPVSLALLTEKIIHSLSHLIPGDRSVITNIKPAAVFLDTDRSHSMAVVINELFSNSIKHALPKGTELEITIEILEQEGNISYLYCDSGPGFPSKVLAYEYSNVGLYLIQNIVKQSLRGSVKIENTNGAKITLKFPGGNKVEELEYSLE